MTLTVINNNWTGPGPRYTLSANETVFIGSGLSLISTGSVVLRGSASDIAVVISSGTTLYANSGAIRFEESVESNRSIDVEQGAVVSSDFYAVFISGNNFNLENAGQLSGVVFGVAAQIEDSLHTGHIVNSGQIVGGDAGIIYELSTDSGTITLSNNGLIWGGNFSLRSASSTAYRITNDGEMRGAVELGNLADLVDNVGGIINGVIDMGGGDDTLRVGSSRESVVGGLGNDLLDFTDSGTVRVFLTTPASNTGAAARDIYDGFETSAGR